MVDLVVEVGEADSEIAVDLVIVVVEVAIVVVTVVAAEVAVEAMAVIAEASVGEEVAIEEDTIVADEVAVVRHLGKHKSLKICQTIHFYLLFFSNSDRGRDRSRPY